MFLTFNTSIFSLNFYFDLISLVSSFMLVSVAIVILIYSYDYFNSEIYSIKFIVYMALFSLFMLMLFLSNSPFTLILGWEGVGLMSYFLISWWSSRSKSLSSALLAVTTNRLGDLSVLLFICIMMQDQKIIIGFLILAMIVKSAQFCFHSWLPQAMESPTPVSSFLHSSTMVMASVYVYIRMNNIFNDYSNTLLVLLSSVTMVYGGLWSGQHYDLKKIIAFSTLSQLGFMFFNCSINSPVFTLFIMFLHSFFKSLLFMCSGVFIHSSGSNQFINSLKFSFISNKLTSFMFIMSTFSLMGLPFFSGFYSKHLSVELFMSSWVNSLNMLFMVFSSSLTVFYCIKLLNSKFYPKYVLCTNYEYLTTLKWSLLNLFFLCTLSYICVNFVDTSNIMGSVMMFSITFVIYFLGVTMAFFNLTFFINSMSYEFLMFHKLTTLVTRVKNFVNKFDNLFWDLMYYFMNMLSFPALKFKVIMLVLLIFMLLLFKL